MEKIQENQNIEVKKEKEAVVENPDVKIVSLKRPVNIDGAFLNEVKLEFGKMTGADVLTIDEELKAEGHIEGFNSVHNQQVLLKIASKASGVLPDDLLKLSLYDFAEVTFSARNFFFQ